MIASFQLLDQIINLLHELFFGIFWLTFQTKLKLINQTTFSEIVSSYWGKIFACLIFGDRLSPHWTIISPLYCFCQTDYCHYRGKWSDSMKLLLPSVISIKEEKTNWGKTIWLTLLESDLLFCCYYSLSFSMVFLKVSLHLGFFHKKIT